MDVPNNSQYCQSDTSYCKFGSETLLKLLKVFEDQIEGIVNNEEDIEYVHKTRVSSRRLRAALPLFRTCFPAYEFKEWSSQIKKVTPLLANARDLDVQITFIEKYLKKLRSKTQKVSAEMLLEDHRDLRKSIQPSIVNELENLKSSNILDDISKFCEQTISELSNVTFDPDQVLGKAHWHISFRLDDFLSMEKYIYEENEKLKHHRMRIFAKKLRYTLEIFAPLYKNELKREIDVIKEFQDILGEMHDCDVWIDYVPKFIEKTKINKENKKTNFTRVEQALLNFLGYIKQRRHQNYSKFVKVWTQTVKNGFFNKLRKTINAGLIMPEAKKLRILAKPDVKIAVMSDVHANMHALEAVFEDVEKRGADIILNAGDSIGFGPYPNEVIELLCEKNVLSIVGNYDLEVIEGKAKAKGEKKTALKFARKKLAKSVECYLSSLPRELKLKVGDKKLLITHGSPNSIEEHIYFDTPLDQLKIYADAAKADVIIIGHSHEQFWKQTNEASFVNPGSVGRPDDGNPQTAYALLSFNPFNVELIRLDYEVEASADALRKKGLPESFAQMLLRGVSLGKIKYEDNSNQESMIQNCRVIAEESENISKRYWPDSDHYMQVTRIALELFDGLNKVHQLGQRERCWLECAAILHDIGLSKSINRHHKKTAKLILNDTKLPFTSQGRRIIANIARYHRKGLPKRSHYNLQTLDRSTLHRVKILASLLRLADALDYSHESIIKVLNIKIGTKRITVECISETKSVLEEQAFNKKKDLFENVFAKKLVLTWKRQ